MNRVFQFRAYPPRKDDDRARVMHLLSLAHDYRCQLVWIERERRRAVRAIEDAPSEQAAAEAAHERLDEAIDAVRKTRAETRHRSETQEQKDAIAAARKAYQAACKALYEARKARRIAGAEEIALIKDRTEDLRRGARELSGLSGCWGTYLDIEAADAKVRAVPLYDYELPNDPRYPRERDRGAGQIAVQLQGGLDVGKAFAGRDTRFKIEQVPDVAIYDRAARKRSRKDKRLVPCALRVGSDARAPVWCEVNVVLARPLPEGGRIKWARLSVRRHGPHEYWSLEVTVEMDPPKPTARTASVGVNLGWRTLPSGGLRVGVATNEAGRVEECQIDAETMRRLVAPDELHSLREHKFQLARGVTARWLSINMAVPPWLRASAETIALWHSPARLVALANRWKANRFEGDEIAFAALDAWADMDHFLWSEEESWRQSALAGRREKYRVWAASLASRYGTLVIEDFDLRRIARKRRVDEPADNETSRGHRHLAAVHTLRGALVQAFLLRGGSVWKLPAENITRRCPVCGVVEKFDAASVLAPTCPNGHTMDQDERAGRNLLERLKVAGADGTAKRIEIPQETENRWAKLKRLKAERLGAPAQDASDGALTESAPS